MTFKLCVECIKIYAHIFKVGDVIKVTGAENCQTVKKVK